jgi:hypothetical protein
MFAKKKTFQLNQIDFKLRKLIDTKGYKNVVLDITSKNKVLYTINGQDGYDTNDFEKIIADSKNNLGINITNVV